MTGPASTSSPIRQSAPIPTDILANNHSTLSAAQSSLTAFIAARRTTAPPPVVKIMIYGRYYLVDYGNQMVFDGGSPDSARHAPFFVAPSPTSVRHFIFRPGIPVVSQPRVATTAHRLFYKTVVGRLRAISTASITLVPAPSRVSTPVPPPLRSSTTHVSFYKTVAYPLLSGDTSSPAESGVTQPPTADPQTPSAPPSHPMRRYLSTFTLQLTKRGSKDGSDKGGSGGAGDTG